MQTIRTIAWVIVAIIFVSFVAINWVSVPVNFWPLQEGYLHFNWPVGLVALLSFLLGLIPMWLLVRATRWRLNRRIATLENSLRAAAVTTPVAVATATQLDAVPASDPYKPVL